MNVKKKPKRRSFCMACGRPISGKPVRGCHAYCNRKNRELVDLGLDTELGLIAASKWLKKGTPGVKPTNPATRRIADERSGD